MRKFLITFLVVVLVFTSVIYSNADIFEPFKLVDDNDSLFIKNETLYGLKEQTLASSIIEKFIYKDAMTASDELLGTGDTISFQSEGMPTPSVVKALVFGDVSGDSRVNGVDYLKIKKGMSTEGYLQGVYYWAADLNCDGEINASDYLKVKKHATGTYNIFEHIPESIRPTPTPEPTPTMTPTLVVNNQVLTDVEGIVFNDGGVRWVSVPFFSICEALGADISIEWKDEFGEYVIITINGYETTFYNNGSYIDIEIEELDWMTREKLQYDSTLDDYIANDYFIRDYLSQIGYEIEFDFNTSTVTINSIA